MTSNGVLCSVTGKREVTCFQRNEQGLISSGPVVATNFDLVNPYHLGIYNKFLFISSGLNLLVQSLEEGGVGSEFNLSFPIHTIRQSAGGVHLLYLRANGSRIHWMPFNERTRTWELNRQMSRFLGDSTIFTQTTSNVVFFQSLWGDSYITHGAQGTGGPHLTMTQLYFGMTYTTNAPSGCKKITNILHSPHQGKLIVLCSGKLFAYSYNDDEWSTAPNVGTISANKLYLHPKGTFIAALLPSSSKKMPNQIVFMNLEWQKAFISLRKGSLHEALFTEDSDLFCLTETKMSSLTCHNVSMLLSNDAFSTPAMYTYKMPTRDAVVMGSIGKHVVVRYMAEDNNNKTMHAVLPKVKLPPSNKIEIDREALCAELRTALPTLGKLFCFKSE